MRLAGSSGRSLPTDNQTNHEAKKFPFAGVRKTIDKPDLGCYATRSDRVGEGQVTGRLATFPAETRA